jgi:hypothetical protein
MISAGKELRHYWPAALAAISMLLLAPSCSEQISVVSSINEAQVESVDNSGARGTSSLLGGVLGTVTGTVDSTVGVVSSLLAPQTSGIMITVSGLTATVSSPEKFRRVDIYMENGAKFVYDKSVYKYTYKSTSGSNVWDVYVETVYGKTQWYRVRENNIAFQPSGSTVKISSTFAMKKVLVYGEDGVETQFSSGSNQGFVRTFSTVNGKPVWDVFVETEMGGKWFLDRTPVIRFTASGTTATVKSTHRLRNVTLYTEAGNSHQFSSNAFVATFTVPDRSNVVEGFAEAEQGSRWYRSGDAKVRIAVSNKRADVTSTRPITDVWVLTTLGEKYYFKGDGGLKGIFMVPGPPEIADVYVNTVQGGKWFLDNYCPPIDILVAGATATVTATASIDSVTLYTASGLAIEAGGLAAMTGVFNAPAGEAIVDVCAKAGGGSKWFLDNSRWYPDSATLLGAWFQDPDGAWYQDGDGKWYQNPDTAEPLPPAVTETFDDTSTAVTEVVTTGTY